jgi:UDP-glucose 4-epimerase
MDTAQKTVLVTGGAGYIGAHVIRELLKNDYDVAVVDNLSTGLRSNLSEKVAFYEGDFADPALLKRIFNEHKIEAVLHMAASIEVGESVEKPLDYLHNNTIRTEQLLKSMLEADVTKLIFSSTAAVYGIQEKVPISESAATGPLDPYGSSKLLSENLIKFYGQFAGLNAIIFRYFNACGSDFDKQIQDTHKSHLIPHIIDVVKGDKNELTILGTDYPTPDGTGVRDYVHVLDIARAHVVGLSKLGKSSEVEIFNIGTSEGKSVREVIRAVEEVASKKLNVVEGLRRPGDTPITVADNTKIERELNFKLIHSDLKTIIETSLS